MIRRIHAVTAKRCLQFASTVNPPRIRTKERSQVKQDRLAAYYCVTLLGGPALAIVAISSMGGIAMFLSAWLGIGLAATGVWTFIRRRSE